MRSSLLSVGRYIDQRNPQLVIPQMSILAVNFRRESFEEIRKNKGIPVRVLEKKVNLSKSRYYRWLKYQVDLPMELIIGMKKVFNIADSELMELFVATTDEQLELLNLVIYTSLSDRDEEFHLFLESMERLDKYRQNTEENMAYKLILAYGDLLLNCLKNQSVSGPLATIESYFHSIDYLTTFDVQLYLAVLYIKQTFGMDITSLDKEVVLLEKSLLRKLEGSGTKETRELYVGCALDLASYYFEEGKLELANVLLNSVQKILADKQLLSHYELELFRIVANMYGGTWDEETIQEHREIIAAAIWHLPACDVTFMNDLLYQGGQVFEKVDDKYC